MDEMTAQALVTLVEDTVPRLRGLEVKAVLAELARTYDDLLCGLDWFIAQGRVDEALRLASALVPFWMSTARLEEGAATLERVLALPSGGAAQRARALEGAGYIRFFMGDDERARAFEHQAVEFGKTGNNPTVVALALSDLARIALRTDIEEARRLCRDALAVTEGTGEVKGRSSALHVLGVACQMAGDLEQARDLMRQRIALGRAQDDYLIVGSESGNLSMVERQLGHLDVADALVHEALEIAWRRGDDLMVTWLMNGVAAVARDRGNDERAATLIGCADAGMEAAHGEWPPDELVHYEQTVAVLTDKMGRQEFERARAAGHAMSRPDAVQFARGARPTALEDREDLWWSRS